MPFFWLRLVQSMLSGELLEISVHDGYWTARIRWVGFDYVEFEVEASNQLVKSPTRITVPLSQVVSTTHNPSMALREQLEKILEKQDA